MMSRALIATFVVGVLAVSCGTDPEPPVEVGLAELCANPENYDERDVIVEGVLGLPDSVFSLTGNNTDATLTDGDETIRIGLAISLNDPNTARRLPPEYEDRDLVVWAEDGETLGVGSQARITGRAFFPGCRVNVFTGEEEPHSIVAVE